MAPELCLAGIKGQGIAGVVLESKSPGSTRRLNLDWLQKGGRHWRGPFVVLNLLAQASRCRSAELFSPLTIS